MLNRNQNTEGIQIRARLTMPYEHGRTDSIFEKSADRRIHSIFRRSIDQNNYKSCPKEFGFRSSEQRLPLLTIIFLDTHASRKVSPFPSLLPGDFCRKNFESISSSNMENSKPPSPHVFKDPVMLNSSCISSEASSLDQSDSRNKLSNSLDSSTTSLPGCLISGNSSGSVCDNPIAIGSDFLVSAIPKVDKRVKRNSRKKGKKKGKQYKRTASRKVLTDSNVQCEENNYSASAFETSESSSLSSSAKHVLDIKLSDEATPPDLLFTDVTVEKDDSANNVEFVDCSTTLLSCTSYSDETDHFEPVSSPQIFARDEFGCNTTAYLDLSSTIKDAEMVPFSSDGSTRVVFKENNIFHDNFSSVSMDNYNSVVDSSFDGSNSDIGENSSDDTVMRSPVKDESQPSSSEGEIFSPSKELIQHESSSHTTVNLCSVNTNISNNCYTSDAYLSNDVLDACSSTERADCSSQAGSNNDFHPVIAGKRGRRSRRIIGNGSLNGTNRYFTANNHSHTGKDNNYSIWQKVQKIERKEGASKPNNISVLSHGEVSSKETKTKMKLDKFVGLKQKQCGTTYRYPCPDDTFKIEASQAAPNCHKTVQPLSKSAVGNSVNSMKSKSSSAVKHANQCNISGSHTGKSDMDKALKHHVQQEECLRNSSFTAFDKDHNIGFRSPNNSFSQRCLAKPTDDCCQPEPEKEIHVHTEEATPPRNTCNGVCLMDLPAVHSEIGQTPTTMNQIGHRQIEGNSEVGPTKYRESSSLSSSAGNLIQKWVPVGRKDSVYSDTGYFEKVSITDDAVTDRSYPNAAGLVGSSLNKLFSVSKDGEFSNPGAGKLIKNLSSCPHSAEASDLQAEINFQTHEMKDKEFNSVATELDKIIQAVNDAYKLQTMAEGVQLVTGRPYANFEKFLFLASPVIRKTQHSRSCNSCFPEQLISNSFCCHQIPNIALKSIWQWYEEPGCFGLEVRAHDYCNSRRQHNGRSEFTAYFVPYLSAVQLFGKSRSARYCNSSGEAAITCEEDKREKYLASFPNLSMLLPQSHKDTNACLSESSSAAEDIFDKSIHMDHAELIFEYFESDQPPWRRPLYEKIKELVSGDKLPASRIFGDPLKLESLNLHDLHPASWYCVAWYPIYRIPDGNFHAAFLTYHSLGHFVHQSASACVPGAFTNVVSPVVGLQTYRDKGENWFQPRDMDLKVFQSEEAHFSYTSDLLKERLRTLKQTASVMARAVVHKRDQRSANRHPDYEFFVSRSW
ncbi:hypothetical protein C4D60_Mb04t15660 [Musa balbisiana]|uniref:Uncharacterized protein n=1 Tax=Musa balbisiana TaxID=52838 RepID=A0A4S8KCB2_MUSBA|nr:hypothetical protein C4D60_Mb04t15660 [Musa balbisiana]